MFSNLQSIVASMGKMLAVIITTLLVISMSLPSLPSELEVEQKRYLSYPAIGPRPKYGPKNPINNYTRGCSATTRCRGNPPVVGSRRLLIIDHGVSWWHLQCVFKFYKIIFRISEKQFWNIFYFESYLWWWKQIELACNFLFFFNVLR